ncbi:MAG: cytidine deaminase [Thermoanaerobaculia bacterium]
MTTTITNGELMEKARAARQHAHAPYSKYYVGSAIVDENGELHVGCNVENSAYPQGSCAEACAIGAMVSAGARRIVKIAVAGGGAALGACTPCGGCRQRIKEFSDRATRIIVLDGDGELVEHTIDDLLPAPTTPV